MKSLIRLAIVAAIGGALLSSCATAPTSGPTRPVRGVVLELSYWKNQKSGAVGGTIGGVAGGVAGSFIGSGSAAAALGAIGGAIVGSVVGSSIQRAGQSDYRLLATIRSDEGYLYNLVPDKGQERWLVPGSIVYVNVAPDGSPQSLINTRSATQL